MPQWDGQQALTIFEQMLQKSSNKIDGVARRQRHDRQLDDLRAARPASSPSIPTTGLDATAGALQHLLAGEQSMTVYFSIKDQATKAANLAVQVARGEKPTGVTATVDTGTKKVPTIFLKPQTIRKDNIADTVIADDFVVLGRGLRRSLREVLPGGPLMGVGEEFSFDLAPFIAVPRPRGVRARAARSPASG